MRIGLSVIIPVYNVEKYLERCIESVLVQNYNSYEIILVDDGSTDSSPIICDKYAQKFKHVSVVHKKNGGLSDARNVGIQNAKGKYVFFLDSDDWIVKDMFANVSNVLVTNEYDIFQFGMQMFNTEQDKLKTRISKESHFSGIEAFKNMLKSNEITSFSTDKLYKRELFLLNKIEFPKGAYYEDLGTIYKLLLASEKICSSNQIYYCYFMRNEAAITKSWSLNKFSDMYHFYNEIFKAASKILTDSLMLVKAYYNNGLVYLLMKLYEEGQENTDIYSTILKELSKNKIPPNYLSGYSNHMKYILYRVNFLKIIAKLKVKLGKNR
ncbi:glycosyltransferase [Streptococcus sp. NSJ-72]|uniref:glycosyltransferase family 2 protein n=1 Tax=Streptococcus sp. NSJ-72 TaxID=2763068 RepID=UPI001651AD52|nr:glycosyltransferase [Streptococcus sp. NSJ-72]QNL42196.1 glycosyltransferase [Streptococcus sp. NSJ-72]